MNSIFQELLYEGVLANYMDNFYTSENKERTRRTNNTIPKNGRKV